MSDLLAIRDFDSAEFIERLAGLYRHCQDIAVRAATLQVETERRVAGIRLNTFKGLAEIGEALLRVQEQRPGGFGEWFEQHRDRLGFSSRHAESCKAAARKVREKGLEAAYQDALNKAARETRPMLHIPTSIDSLPEDRVRELYEKIAPIYAALAARLGAAALS